MTDRCLPLLKYRKRDCYSNSVADIDANTGDVISEWEGGFKTQDDLENAKIWMLVFPGAVYPIRKNPFGDIQYFHQCEFHAAGDPNPIAVCFDRGIHVPNPSTSNRVLYQLPASYDYLPDNSWERDIFISAIQPILQEYERGHEKWKTRILVNLPHND